MGNAEKHINTEGQSSKPKSALDWLDEIEYEDLLTSDLRLILQQAGSDVLKVLLEKMPSITIYLTTRPLDEARKRYIIENYTGRNAKQLAIKLQCSERFIHKVAAERSRLLSEGIHEQKTLFNR